MPRRNLGAESINPSMGAGPAQVLAHVPPSGTAVYKYADKTWLPLVYRSDGLGLLPNGVNLYADHNQAIKRLAGLSSGAENVG